MSRIGAGNGGVDQGRSRWICTNVDSPTIGFLVEALRSEGRDAGVVTLIGETEYRRGLALGLLARLRLRFRMYVAYPLMLALRVLRAPRGTNFVVTTNCFFAPLLASMIGRWRHISVTHLLFDLFPDGLEVGGKIAVNGIAARLLGFVPRLTQRRAAGVVYLGKALRRHVEARWGGNSRSTCIDVGTDETLFPPHPPAWEGGSLSVRYGGQLGYFHDAEVVARCIRAAGTDEGLRQVTFVFLASGAGARFLRGALADLQVRVDLPVEEGWR